ncbi:poly-beta-1,6-N-acetyl-D-glucosamine biosynthesis protein PgaD [Bacillus sp. 1P06AnD]|uniref:poly-beta-1,6-N-acetyl-D-glucosamine biosynthesis protein PgaD n=1 Tax=Bacillus sp. 1P06AnD TaxID=3132208 RepID=UPI0039A3CF5C
MVIQQKKKKARTMIELAVTLFGWAFLLSFLYILIRSFKFSFNLSFSTLTIANINSIVLFTILIIFMSLSLFFFWVTYNKKRYGHLTRRKFPADTTVAQVAEYYSLSEEEVLNLQKNRHIIR